MDLEKITTRIRPRKNWEAADLGVAMAQRHLLSLIKIWLIITLPLFLLGSLFFEQHSIWLMLSMWWLKPLWERPLLHLLSRELFGESLTVKQCVKTFFSLAKIQWFASLTWRRLSFTRSLDLPIIQLEGLAGEARSQRLKVIHSIGSGSAVWLTLLFVLTETFLYFGFLALGYLLLPANLAESFDFFNWMSLDSESGLAGFMMNLLTYLAMTLVAPFYVACGFATYINQRTLLEAWDIELSFRRLAKKLQAQSQQQLARLANWVAVSGLLVLLLGTPSGSLQAAQQPSPADEMVSEPFIDGPLIDDQSISHTEADIAEQSDVEQQAVVDRFEKSKRLINEIKASEDFNQTEQDYRYVNNNPQTKNEEPSLDMGLWTGLGRLISIVAEFALWVFVAVLLIFLIMRYRHLLVSFQPHVRVKTKRPKTIFGLDLTEDNLPDNPWQVARQLIQQEHYREALSLLYRASLIWYIDNTNVVIQEGDTELECLAKIGQVSDHDNRQFMQQLTNQWRQLAYAHLLPEQQAMLSLCDSWPNRPASTNQKPVASHG